MILAHASGHAPLLNLALTNIFLCLAFFAGSLFYLYRLFSAEKLLHLNGYFDAENEIGHLLCLLAMTFSLAPASLQIVPAPVWAGIFSFGTIWFALRARLWGKNKTWNKEWYDWAHAGMCFGMFWMYMPLSSHWLSTALIGAFWTWFAGYYFWLTYHDAVTRPHFLSLGQDIAHLAMGVVMLLMTFLPAAFTNHHHGGHHAASPVPELAVALEVKTVTDTDFRNEVLNNPAPVVVLVLGGCESCSNAGPAFQEAASDFCGQVKFVRINKETAPEAAQALGVKECPCILIVKNGAVLPERLTKPADSSTINNFVKQLAPDSQSRP